LRPVDVDLRKAVEGPMGSGHILNHIEHLQEVPHNSWHSLVRHRRRTAQLVRLGRTFQFTSHVGVKGVTLLVRPVQKYPAARKMHARHDPSH
jgi:hypothetical protein